MSRYFTVSRIFVLVFTPFNILFDIVNPPWLALTPLSADDSYTNYGCFMVIYLIGNRKLKFLVKTLGLVRKNVFSLCENGKIYRPGMLK